MAMALMNAAPAVSQTGRIRENTGKAQAMPENPPGKTFAELVEKAGRAEESRPEKTDPGKASQTEKTSEKRREHGEHGKNAEKVSEKNLKKPNAPKAGGPGSRLKPAQLRGNKKDQKESLKSLSDKSPQKQSGKKTPALDSAFSVHEAAAPKAVQTAAPVHVPDPDKTKRTKAAPRSARHKAVDAPNLTSRAGRVEVIDKRAGTTEQKAQPLIESESGNRLTLRRRSGSKEPVDTQKKPNVLSENNGNAAFKLPVAETDIELTPSGTKSFQRFSAAQELARKLDAQAGNDIVRQVKVVLNRADAGEVRINLRPENLGRVSVRIQLQDNQLSGRIFVESAAAREAFRAALDGLQTRLVESGFGSASLELSWNDSSAGFAGGEPKQQKGSELAAQAAPELENRISAVFVDETDNGRINMVV
ncbi:MAG: hypothetical protein CSA76_02985 [Spirochaetales bacterium]|nr:MAG: hypothetical protein CSA76_02985 [Spirochaetales bacterium]